MTERIHVEPQLPPLILQGGEDAPPSPVIVEKDGTWYRRVGLLTLWTYFGEPGGRNEDPPVIRPEIMADLERLGGTYGCTLVDGVMHFAFPSEAAMREFEARSLTREI